ncbi:hypothetical protein ACFDR9_002908 [Janthinobacterium sp. CG_23.3]|uniref:hypothetical protein n=1 Tax=Janthinobacterium sp. CG_23.3 TaxID=3349634 RepID=UPI0038D47A06
MSLHCEPPTPLRPRTWRGHFATTDAVERCVSLQASFGTLFAAVLMRTQGIDIGVAIRVLVRPRQRRPLPQDIYALRTYFSPPPLIYSHTHY